MIARIHQIFRWICLKIKFGKCIEMPCKGTFVGKIHANINKNSKLKIGKGFSCRDNIIFNISKGGARLEIGNNTFINDGCKINVRKNITIGSGCIIGQNVLMYDHDHNYHSIDTLRNDFIADDIVIGNDVWIGSNVVILRGTIIGDGCVIGAGSIIKGRVEHGTLVYPMQSQVVKKIREDN